MNPLTTDIIVYFKSIPSNKINITIVMAYVVVIKTFQYCDFWDN